MTDLWQRLFPQDLYVVQEETPVLFFLSFFVDLPKESVICEEAGCCLALARSR